ncbi:hypothetical protein D3C81_1796110 [compost metagenome]
MAAQVGDGTGEEIGIVGIGAHQAAEQLLHWQEADIAQLLLAPLELREHAQGGAQRLRQCVDDLHALGGGQGGMRTITTDAQRMTDDVQLLQCVHGNRPQVSASAR